MVQEVVYIFHGMETTTLQRTDKPAILILNTLPTRDLYWGALQIFGLGKGVFNITEKDKLPNHLPDINYTPNTKRSHYDIACQWDIEYDGFGDVISKP